MPASDDTALSTFMAAYRCEITDLAALSRELGADVRRAGPMAVANRARLRLARVALGRVKLLLLAVGEELVVADNRSPSIPIAFRLGDGAEVGLPATSGSGLRIVINAGVASPHGTAGLALDPGSLWLIVVVARDAVLEAMEAMGVIGVAPPIPSGAGGCATLKHAAILAVHEFAVAGAALHEPAMAERFERFVLATLARGLARRVAMPARPRAAALQYQ